MFNGRAPEATPAAASDYERKLRELLERQRGPKQHELREVLADTMQEKVGVFRNEADLKEAQATGDGPIDATFTTKADGTSCYDDGDEDDGYRVQVRIVRSSDEINGAFFRVPVTLASSATAKLEQHHERAQAQLNEKQQAVDALVQPIKESLTKVDGKLGEIERTRIDYLSDNAPIASMRMQEVFGLAATPRIGGGAVPVTFELLSPARRPLQVTRDLASFLKNAYLDVRKDMRGRYPRHYWPENPLEAEPTRRVKPRT